MHADDGERPRFVGHSDGKLAQLLFTKPFIITNEALNSKKA